MNQISQMLEKLSEYGQISLFKDDQVYILGLQTDEKNHRYIMHSFTEEHFFEAGIVLLACVLADREFVF